MSPSKPPPSIQRIVAAQDYHPTRAAASPTHPTSAPAQLFQQPRQQCNGSQVVAAPKPYVFPTEQVGSKPLLVLFGARPPLNATGNGTHSSQSYNARPPSATAHRELAKLRSKIDETNSAIRGPDILPEILHRQFHAGETTLFESDSRTTRLAQPRKAYLIETRQKLATLAAAQAREESLHPQSPVRSQNVATPNPPPRTLRPHVDPKERRDAIAQRTAADAARRSK